MNLIKEFLNIVKETYSIFSKNYIYTTFFSVIYVNIIPTNIFIKNIINISSLVNLYINRKNIFEKLIVFTINSYCLLKIYIQNIYNKYIKKVNPDFILESALLYSTLVKNHDITDYFKNKNINKIDKYILLGCFNDNNIDTSNLDNNLRLKLIFFYKDNKYILYYGLEKIFNNEIDYIPYPPYNEKILNNYRKDIIIPYYTKESNKNLLYSLFNIDSKDILEIKIDNNQEKLDDNKIINYFQMIKTPFNDFGILYNCPIKLRWILYENGIDIYSFNKFYLKFLNLYFDEEKMDLIPHFIEFNQNEVDNVLISNRMKEIIIQKKNINNLIL